MQRSPRDTGSNGAASREGAGGWPDWDWPELRRRLVEFGCSQRVPVHDREDFSQDAMIALLEQITRGTQVERAGAFLRLVFRRRAADARRRRREVVGLDGSDVPVVAAEAGGKRQGWRAATSMLLGDARCGLTPSEVRIVHEVLFGGHATFAAVARALGVQPQNLQRAFAGAKRKLLGALERRSE